MLELRANTFKLNADEKSGAVWKAAAKSSHAPRKAPPPPPVVSTDATGHLGVGGKERSLSSKIQADPDARAGDALTRRRVRSSRRRHHDAAAGGRRRGS